MRRHPALLRGGVHARPWLGTGAHRPAAAARLASSSRSTRALELGLGEFADAGALQGAAGVDVGEGGAAADLVEAGDGAVAVVADRQLPAVLADQFANGVAVVADVQREEVHAPTVAPVDGIDDVLLVGAVAAFGEPERDHQRPLEEVADAERPGGVDPAGGGAAGVLGTGQRRSFRSRPGRRWRRLRARPAAAGTANSGSGQRGGWRSRPSVPSPPPLLEGPDRGDDDEDEEEQADDDRVAVPHRSPRSRPGRRAAPPSPRPGRRRGRSR